MNSKRLSTTLLMLVLLTSLALPVFAADPKPAAKAAPANKPIYVDMKTSVGTITIELWPDKAPTTVRNFTNYVTEGHYDGTIFHRVIKGFMIQGGGFTADMTQKPTHDPIPLEAKYSNKRGTISMARTNDPNSATSQFFINTVDNDNLDPDKRPPGYTVFGKVVKGMDVVDKIESQPTGVQKGMRDVPVTTVTIEKVTLAH